MSAKAYLILENGRVFEGKSFGAAGETIGEVVFATGMTGYLETLTDKSYYGQIITQTFPLIGNYGVIPDDFESNGNAGGNVAAKGYIVRDWCDTPSNFRNEGKLDEFLQRNNIVGLYDIDTRELTKLIREKGVMNGKISASPALDDMGAIKNYSVTDAIKSVSAKAAESHGTGGRLRVALMDYGLKNNIRRELVARGCDVTVFPHDTKASDILSQNPDGIMLSNGPGDPAENTGVINELKTLCSSGTPIFGICLGHQLLALANGFSTHKLKYGHRGANQPAKDTVSGRTYITSQNHGYAVMSDSIDNSIADEWFINVNDNTCEGILYKNAPVLSVQFHPEACGGPKDTAFLFDKFIDVMEGKIS